jgi:hypothetical protein
LYPIVIGLPYIAGKNLVKNISEASTKEGACPILTFQKLAFIVFCCANVFNPTINNNSVKIFFIRVGLEIGYSLFQ